MVDTKEKYRRPSWDEYFMDVCRAIAKRATCDRGRSGCVIARDHQILVTGYVGAPTGLPHCDDVGHQFKNFNMRTEALPNTVSAPSMQNKTPSARQQSEA